MSSGGVDLDLITRAEAAEILTVSEKTVKKLIAAGKLPAYRISPSCTRLRRSEVLAYVESALVRAPGAAPTVKLSTMKDIKRRRELEALGSGYYPGMVVARCD